MKRMRRSTCGGVVKKHPLFGGAEFHKLIDFPTKLNSVDRVRWRRIWDERQRSITWIPTTRSSSWSWRGGWTCKLGPSCVEANIPRHHSLRRDDVEKEFRHFWKVILRRKRDGTQRRIVCDLNSKQNGIAPTKRHRIVLPGS